MNVLQQPQETDRSLKVPGMELGVGMVNRRVNRRVKSLWGRHNVIYAMNEIKQDFGVCVKAMGTV